MVLVPPPGEGVARQDVKDFPVSWIGEGVSFSVCVAGGEKVFPFPGRNFGLICGQEAVIVPPAPSQGSGFMPPLGLCHHHTPIISKLGILCHRLQSTNCLGESVVGVELLDSLTQMEEH